MRPGGGRQKGASFENKVARIIREAYGVDSKECYRTPRSGGHAQLSQTNPGDLIIGPELRNLGFNYSVECKHKKKVDLWKLLEGEVRSPVYEWIDQCLGDIEKSDTQGDVDPLVIFKANGPAPIMCIVQVYNISLYSVSAEDLIPNLCFEYKDILWMIISLSSFLSRTTPWKKKKRKKR